MSENLTGFRTITASQDRTKTRKRSRLAKKVPNLDTLEVGFWMSSLRTILCTEPSKNANMLFLNVSLKFSCTASV